MFLLDPDWNPATDAQTMGRIWRDGQIKPVHIYRMISSGTIEESILKRQEDKHDLWNVDVGDDDDQRTTTTKNENENEKQEFASIWKSTDRTGIVDIDDIENGIEDDKSKRAVIISQNHN